MALLSVATTSFAKEISPERLIEISPVIAIVSISDAPKPKIEDAALNPQIYKQRVPARCIKRLKGNAPENLIIENEENSVITAGFHLAFLRPLGKDRFILSSPFSLRRISDNQVYWFPHEYVPLREVSRFVKSQK